MEQQNLQEVWQVEVGGTVYEAAFGELGDWINEGSLLPEDKVRKGNLRWIEARQVPYLIPFFNAKESGLPMPVIVQTVNAVLPDAAVESPHSAIANSPIPVIEEPITPIASPPQTVTKPLNDPNFCSVHRDVATAYLCNGCGTAFCKTCPKSFGGTVKICPNCGEMCRSLNEARQLVEEHTKITTAVTEGFGANDFFKAFAHPFKFKTSLFFGSLMFMFFTLGQSSSIFGGIYMIVGAVFAGICANALRFGVLSNTIENFSQGKLDKSFMPDFDDFSTWDDVIHPFFLGVGVIISSFGPFIVTMLIGLYLVTSSVDLQRDAIQKDLENIPGTHYYTARDTVKQSDQVKSVLGDTVRKNDERLALQNEIAAGNSNVAAADQETLDQERLAAQIQESQKTQLESAFGKTPETRESENQAIVQSFLALAPPLVVIGAILFLWGLFYFPAACAVAGYTRLFTATINPLVGLDTIRRLGGTYVKILLMGLAIVITSLVIGGMLSLILSSFDMPGVGNLPAKALNSFFTFYFSIVFSCVLGYALFKSADKLHLPR
jgi:hypothetical protein